MKPKLNRLANLLALNRSSPRDYRVVTASGSNEATVYLYDVIGYDWWTEGGVTAQQFAKDLQALGSKKLHLRVNSPGGDVFEGRAMVASLQAYPGTIVAHVDGLAASAASFLVMHADEIEMTDGAFMMIHNGWTLAIGDHRTMTDTAALLQKIDGAIADDYLTRATAKRDQITQWMDAETWFTAAEAIGNGLADRIAPTKDAGGNAQARAWNVSAYSHAPPALVAKRATATDPQSEHEHRFRRLNLIELNSA